MNFTTQIRTYAGSPIRDFFFGGQPFYWVILMFFLVVVPNTTKAQSSPFLQPLTKEKIVSLAIFKEDTSRKQSSAVYSSAVIKRNKSVEDFNTEDFKTLIPFNFAENLSKSITFKTITTLNDDCESNEEFLKFHAFLKNTYPLVHQYLSLEIVNKYNLLYRWEGKKKNLKPILMIAHMDVVPIEPGTEEHWEYPAFAGTIADGYIWGRGAIDDKVRIVGVLEAVESLLANGYQPDRDIYFAFGSDEELSGQGAESMSSLLRSRNIKFESVLDEGGGIAEGLVPNISSPLGFIGVAEKGYLTIELSVNDQGGHSSYPQQESVLSILSGAVHRVSSNQFPTRLTAPVREMLREISGKMSGIEAFAAKHPITFSKILKSRLSEHPFTNSLIQTTTAVTMFEGGVRENVMPTHAQATINFRILPGDNIKSVVNRVRKVINDKRVSINPNLRDACDPPKVSNVHSASYKILKKTIQSVYGDTLTIVPCMTIVSSDSRHYDKIVDNIYRFSPIWAKPGDVERVHGTNERIHLDDYAKAITFYAQYMVNMGRKEAFNPLIRK